MALLRLRAGALTPFGDRAATAVRNEHLANLRAVRQFLRQHLRTGPAYFRSLFAASDNARVPLAFSRPGGCGLRADQTSERWRDLFEIFVWQMSLI